MVITIKIVFSLYDIFNLINKPIIDNPNTAVHGIYILLCLFAFFISLLGEYYKKPSRRIIQYVLIVTGVSVFSLNYLAITFNSMFIKILANINEIEVIPPDLLTGNIRVITLLLPITIIIPIFILSLNVLKDKQGKSKLREYEVDSLLPTVYKSTETSIDLEICKDLKTGLPCIVPEKIWFEHLWLQGGTGAGKSALFVTPLIEQLINKKAFLQHKLKKTTYHCLKKGIVQIKKPISNKWFNENFDMELIEPVQGREKEFYEHFKDYTIGILAKEDKVYKNNFIKIDTFELPAQKSNDFIYQITIKSFHNNMIIGEEIIELETYKEEQIIKTKYIEFESTMKGNIEFNTNYNKDSKKVEHKPKDIDGIINIKIESLNPNYNHSTIVFIKGNGRLVPTNLGMTVVAPDGDLASTTEKIGKEYGVKIHKIDPFQEEINKGGIAKYNPLQGDSPEKIGDIVASILVSMDLGNNAKANPYYTNASVRAIRNLVILLKVTYPDIKDREPTLEDVLSCLNDFTKTTAAIEHIRDNNELRERWQSVLDYFEANFADTPLDAHGRPVTNSTIGSQKRKTQEALGGIINQLDNLLSRKEIKYILCNKKEDSINLSDVIRKGECIAISTRQGHLGERLGRAFALFFILSLQNEVLSRYAENENPEIPHFLIIDEFPMYCNESTETFFSFSRKYKCSVTIAIQNMGQLKKISDEFGETIFTNTTTKLLLPKANLEDRKYWSDFFGNTNEMQLMTGVSTSSMFADNPSYTEQTRGTITETRNISEEEVDSLNFQQLYYSYSNKKGRKTVGKGSMDFIKIKKQNYMSETFDFEPFSITEEEYNKRSEQKKEEEEKKKNLDAINKLKRMEEAASSLFPDVKEKAKTHTKEIEYRTSEDYSPSEILGVSKPNNNTISKLNNKDNPPTDNLSLISNDIDCDNQTEPSFHFNNKEEI